MAIGNEKQDQILIWCALFVGNGFQRGGVATSRQASSSAVQQVQVLGPPPSWREFPGNLHWALFNQRFSGVQENLGFEQYMTFVDILRLAGLGISCRLF
jgi:hypothetical protein